MNDSFPQKRNGVMHSVYGAGVVTMDRYSVSDGDKVQVKFESLSEHIIVPIVELTSSPKHGVSPDPKTSRNSGWVGGNSYRGNRK